MSGVSKDTNVNDPMSDASMVPRRETWAKQSEFILSCLGFAIGFGNLWRFPYLCYKNGGAVFLVPYFTILIIVAIPLLFLELAIGQYISLAPNLLFRELSPLSSGIGWAMMVVTSITGCYFNMVFAWSLFYTFSSFTSKLPWASCDNYYNSLRCFTFEEASKCNAKDLYYFNSSCLTGKDYCAISDLVVLNSTHCTSKKNDQVIKIQDAVAMTSSTEEFYKLRMLGLEEKTSWKNMGTLQWELVGCLALAWTITCLCLIKGIKSSGKVVYLTVSLPLIMIFAFLIRGVTLPGWQKGVQFYLMNIDFSKVMDIQVWLEASTQIFFSLSCGFGGFITLASYNEFTHNCMRDAIIVGLVNSAVSAVGGFAIFSILGFMASIKHVDVSEVVQFGSGLVFVAYPEAVSHMPLPTLWAILFFVMFILLGIDSQFGYMETLLSGIYDYYPLTRDNKSLVVVSLSILMFILGLTMCLQGGVYMFELLNYYSASISVLVIALSEMVALVYVYGYKKIMNHIQKEMNISVPSVLRFYWTSSWVFFGPVSLAGIFLLSFWRYEPLAWNSYLFPPWIQILGWLSMGASLVCIPIFALSAIAKTIRQKKDLKTLIAPSENFLPKHLREEERPILMQLDNGDRIQSAGTFS